MELKNKKINFLGDSITEGHGTSAKDKIYWSLIGKNEGATVRGYGIGGTRFAKQTKPSENPLFDLDFCTRAVEMDPDADIVVIFGGTNDYGHGDAPIGTPADRTNDTFYGACHQLFTTLIERYPQAVIAVMTPLHRTGDDIPHLGNRIADTVTLLDYVRIIREVAEIYSLPVLDLYASSGICPSVTCHREAFVPDGLHPNDAGHEIIARKLANFLKTL